MPLFKNTKKKVTINLLREETACLTGHRPKSLPWSYNETKDNCIKFKNDLFTTFEGAIKYGLKNFLVGMAEGFDMIGAEILLQLRNQYKDIKIIAVIPCIGQEKGWKPSQQTRYHKILEQCDESIILYNEYTKTCMNERNKFMVDNSSVVIACYNGKPSGTGNTIKYAKEQNCKIKIIKPQEYI